MSSLKKKLKLANKPLTAPALRNPCAQSELMSKGGVHQKSTARHKNRQNRRDSKQALKSGNWF